MFRDFVSQVIALKHISAVLLCGFLLLGSARPAGALSSDRPIPHFTYVWYENKLPQSTVLSIAQQQNGVIWLATYGGLVRYSGGDFQTTDPRTAPILKSSAITAVAEDGAGGIWVGTLNGGLFRHQGQELSAVDLPAGIDSVFGIVTDTAGALWLTTNAGVVRVEAGHARLLDDHDGFPPRGFYRAIVADPLGGVWIAADGVGVVHSRGQKTALYTTADGLPSNAVYSVGIDARGVAWVGTQSGPVYFADGRFHREPKVAALDGKRIYTLYGDKQGAMWFAPLDMGLCRLANGQFVCDDTLHGMRGETVRALFEDHEGSLWIGTTSSGVQRLSQSKLITVLGNTASNAVRAVYQVPDGDLWVGTDGGGLAVYREPYLEAMSAYNRQLPSQLIRAITSDDKGRLWVAGTEGVTRFDRAGQARDFGLAEGLPGTIVFAFSPARAGGMWAGTLQGVARIIEERVEVLEGTRGDDTRALYEAPDGRLWIGRRSGIRCWQNGVLDACGTDGLSGVSVFAFHPDDNGDMWLGTSIGIMRVRNGKVTRYLENAGFYGDAIFSLMEDGAGRLWFSSNRGIGQLEKDDLLALDENPQARIAPQWYGIADGMLNAQGNGASQTPAGRASDGTLWFGTPKGVVVVDPQQMQGNLSVPSVAIEQVLVDGQPLALGHGAELGPDVTRLEFHFAGMSYIAPSAVQYRYRLEGFDREWREAGNSRRAYYTNLPPGDYVFRVMASNNDGVWNQAGDSVRFSLLPLWHQTWWVRLLLLLSVLALLGMVFWWRLRAASRREQQLTLEVERRTEALSVVNAQLERIAAQDALTGIANRREFNRRLLAIWEELQAGNDALAVLLVDVDEFKNYNDTHGHLAGDAALAQVAAILASYAQGMDALAARYGGEEFALLLPYYRADEALELARRIVNAIQRSGMPHQASSVTDVITVSIGVASVMPSQSIGPEDVLQAADRALYVAKAQGRNRAVPAVF